MTKFSLRTALAGALAMAFCQCWALVNPVSITPTPERNIPGPISEVVVTYPEGWTCEFSSRALNYYDPAENVDKTGIIYFCGDEISLARDLYTATIDKNVVTFKVNGEPWDLEGRYNLLIPSGAIILTNEYGAVDNCAEVDCRWYINDNPNIDILPGRGDITEFGPVTISIPDGYVVSGGYLATIKPAIYKSDAYGKKIGNALAYCKLPAGKGIADFKGKSEIVLDPPSKPYATAPDFIPEDGAYYLFVLPLNCLKLTKADGSGEPFNVPETTVLWHYGTPKAIDGMLSLEFPSSSTPSMADTMNGDMGLSVVQLGIRGENVSLDRMCSGKIELYYEGELLKALNPADDKQVGLMEIAPAADNVEEYPVSRSLVCYFVDSIDSPEIEKYSKSGSYKLVIPDGLIVVGGVPAAGTSVEYMLSGIQSGIESVESAVSFKVIAIDGRIIGEDLNADELKNLEKGIYIVNGRKLAF
ncbi:MAG: hypothetical protein NC328_05475 [Muribaculum sp.]|nr:hypothetical protein [Muribaculum sp.]